MTHKYYLQNLGCANCAAKMEAKLQKEPFVKEAVIDFVNQKLLIDYLPSDTASEEEHIQKIQCIVQMIESDVLVLTWNAHRNSKSANSHLHDNCCDCHEHSGSHEDNCDCHGHQHSHKDSCDCHEHQHSHAHTHPHENNTVLRMARIAGGTLLSIISLLCLPEGSAQFILLICGYLIMGYSVLLNAFKGLLNRQLFDENFLLVIATFGAFYTGEYPEAVAVMFLYQIGEFLQDKMVDKSKKHLSDAMNIKADYANLSTPEGIVKVSPEDVRVDDIVLIKPNEKIPLDGIVTEGTSLIDTSSLTGESAPQKAEAGDTLLSGCINGSGTLYMKVTKEYTESTVAKILDLVENASARKSPTETFITKFARIYTPIVVVIAVLMAVLPPILTGSYEFSSWVYRACGFLVVSCPCALVISVPLGFFSGIGSASRNGIIIKGSNYLEALNNVKYAVFDKTGTLTQGNFKVTGIFPASGYTEEQLLELAAYGENFSNHPIARSIVAEYNRTVDTSAIHDYEEIAGYGIRARVGEHNLLLGKPDLLIQHAISCPVPDTASGTCAFLAVDGEYAGYLVVADEIKEDSTAAITKLKEMRIDTIMLTGDAKSTALQVGKTLGIQQVHAELLPDGKVQQLENLLSQASHKGKILFVGDGINDAPVLAMADVGVAMGGVGSDAAIEAADIVLMTDEPSMLVKGISIAKYTRKIVTQNIIFSLGVKFIVLILLAMGMGSMWHAVFADVGVSIIAIFNSMRVQKHGTLF